MPPFHFKQFIIHQDQSLFKVNNDAVLLGAWADVDKRKIGLDIGTGTGVIALACCQRNPSMNFDAVELDELTAQEAKENFQRSKFTDRVEAHHVDIQSFALSTNKKYDFIISNPPYFQHEKSTPSQSKTQFAKHTNKLTFSDLLKASSGLMAPNATLNLILPYQEGTEFIGLAKSYDLHLNKKTEVKGRAEKPIERLLLTFSSTQQEIELSKLTIQKSGVRHDYTDEYVELVREFYTIL